MMPTMDRIHPKLLPGQDCVTECRPLCSAKFEAFCPAVKIQFMNEIHLRDLFETKLFFGWVAFRSIWELSASSKIVDLQQK